MFSEIIWSQDMNNLVDYRVKFICNFDYGFAGFCEGCVSNDACDEIGLPSGGVADCQSICETSYLVDIPAPSSPFSISATTTDTSCMLSNSLRNELLDFEFTKIVCPFGVAVAGTASYPDSYLLIMANIIANILDADEDGIADDPTILSFLVATSSDPPMVGGGINQSEEDRLDLLRAWGYGFSAQTWKASASEGAEEVKQIMVEEVFHMIHQWGSAQAYPLALGVDDFTTSIVCREMAKVVCCDPGWQHPENTCPDECGLSVDLPLPGTCNSADCDCVEFYHQVALTLVGATPGWYGDNMPTNENDMENMLSSEFLNMFQDESYNQIQSSSQVNGEYAGNPAR